MSPLSIKLSDVEARKLSESVDGIVEHVFDGCFQQVSALSATETHEGKLAIVRALEAIRRVQDGHRAVMKMRAGGET